MNIDNSACNGLVITMPTCKLKTRKKVFGVYLYQRPTGLKLRQGEKYLRQ